MAKAGGGGGIGIGAGAGGLGALTWVVSGGGGAGVRAGALFPGGGGGLRPADPAGGGGGQGEIRAPRRAPRRGAYRLNPAPAPFLSSPPRWGLGLRAHSVHLKLWGTDREQDGGPPASSSLLLRRLCRAVGQEMVGMAVVRVCPCGSAVAPNVS